MWFLHGFQRDFSILLTLNILSSNPPLLSCVRRLELCSWCRRFWPPEKRHEEKTWRYRKKQHRIKQSRWPLRSKAASPRSQLVSPSVWARSKSRLSWGTAQVWRSSTTKVIRKMGMMVFKMMRVSHASSSSIPSCPPEPLIGFPSALPPSFPTLMVNCPLSSVPPILMTIWRAGGVKKKWRNVCLLWKR